jgi:hypothetical protein
MAFLFVPLLALTIIVVFAVWVYTSRCVVLVVEETAAGNEEIVWPDDPFLDWVWMGGYLAWLVGVWLVPAFLVARLASHGLQAGAKPWLYVGLVLGTFWLTFPVSLLSTMSAESRWAVFHAGLFRRLAANFGHVITFYLISAAIVGVCAPLVVGIGMGTDAFTLLLGALGLGAAVLLISRMLGRLACLARLTDIRRKRRRRARPPAKGVTTNDPWDVPDEPDEEPITEAEAPPDRVATPGFVQPRDLPALHTPYDGDITGYDVTFNDAPAKSEPNAKPKRKRPPREEPMPMQRDAEADRVIEREKETSRQRAAAIVPDKIEMDRLRRKRERPAARPPLAGIGFFLLYPQVAINWVVLAAAFGFLGLCVRGLIAFWPF